MSIALDERYQNYFVFPHIDAKHPEWLSPFELPAVSRRLSDEEASVIAATLVTLLPDQPEDSKWSESGKTSAVRRMNT